MFLAFEFWHLLLPLQNKLQYFIIFSNKIIKFTLCSLAFQFQTTARILPARQQDSDHSHLTLRKQFLSKQTIENAYNSLQALKATELGAIKYWPWLKTTPEQLLISSFSHQLKRDTKEICSLENIMTFLIHQSTHATKWESTLHTSRLVSCCNKEHI